MHPALTNGSYDVARVREDFPILAMQVYGKPLVYLDNAASAQKPNMVLDRIQQAYTSRIRQRPSRPALSSPMPRPRPMRARARRCAAFLNAGRPEEIIFTRNATEAINLVAYTFGRERMKAGRRDRALHHGAPLQHRALAFPARAATAR